MDVVVVSEARGDGLSNLANVLVDRQRPLSRIPKCIL
jgi:hypothetical protein